MEPDTPKAKVERSNRSGCASYHNKINGLCFHKSASGPIFVHFDHPQKIDKKPCSIHNYLIIL